MHYVLIKRLCYVKTEYEYVLFIVLYTLDGIITQKTALLDQTSIQVVKRQQSYKPYHS